MGREVLKMKNNIDDWVKLMESDLTRVAYAWAEAVSSAVNGGNTGDLDAFIEKLKANTILPETNSENAAEQIARLTKWRVKLLKVTMNSQSLFQVIGAIIGSLDNLCLQIANDKYAEYIELDYLPQNPESLATPQDVKAPESNHFEPFKKDDRDNGGWERRPRI
jgi:hypothetical protein